MRVVDAPTNDPFSAAEVGHVEAVRAYVPNFGQILGVSVAPLHTHHVPDKEIVDRVAASTGLSPAEAERVVGDVLAWYADPVEEFVRRRHAHLQLYGMRNAEAFTTIAAELRGRVVAPPQLSERQLRRIVYG